MQTSKKLDKIHVRLIPTSKCKEGVVVTCSASLLSELRRSLSIFSLSSKSSLRDSLRASI